MHHALIRPDGTVRRTSDERFDLDEFPGHSELPLVGLILGVPPRPAPTMAAFPPVPEGATEVAAQYDLATLREWLKREVEAKRYAVETGGIVLNGATVRTDRESQAMIGGARSLAEADPDEPVDFKAASGFVTLDSATVIAIGLAVGRHVRACFKRERELCAAIDAAETVAEALAINIGVGWPE